MTRSVTNVTLRHDPRSHLRAKAHVSALLALALALREVEARQRVSETYLRVYDLPAALHELGLLEEPRLAQQEAGVFRRETRLEIVDAGARQVRHYVLLRNVECC